MARFRKRPVSVEAVRLLWENWGEVCEFAGVGHLSDGKPQGCIVGEDGMRQSFRGNGYGIEGKLGLEIPTLEGLMLAEEGDWVIKGVAGELYPCKPEIFEKTYEHTRPSEDRRLLELKAAIAIVDDEFLRTRLPEIFLESLRCHLGDHRREVLDDARNTIVMMHSEHKPQPWHEAVKVAVGLLSAMIDEREDVTDGDQAAN